MTERTTPRTVVAAAALALAGCSSGGGETTPTSGRATEPQRSPATATDNPTVRNVTQRGALELTSTAFVDGGAIPAWYSRDGANDFGNRRYDGPDPPDGEHTYRFKLFALDTALDLSQSANKREVGAAMDGHILAQTQLTGTFGP